MNIKLFKSLFFIIFLFVALVSCEEIKDELENEEDTLYVKFENDAESEYTITGIRLLVMGKYDIGYEEPDGTFGPNILEDGVTIAPGAHQFFTLDIPNLHYAYYKLTVDDGQGNDVELYNWINDDTLYDGTITHWGGDDRTVSTTIVWNESIQQIVITGWSDWVGID